MAMTTAAYLGGDHEPGHYRFIDDRCCSQPCHYLRFSTEIDEGELSSLQAIPWLTDSTVTNKGTETIESRILFFPRFTQPNGITGLPISIADLDKLIHSYHFPVRYFESEELNRKGAGNLMTSVGPCWFLRDRYFSAVTLLRREERVYQTIIILDGKLEPERQTQILERFRKLRDLWKQPLLPMIILLDCASEAYRDSSAGMTKANMQLFRDLHLDKTQALPSIIDPDERADVENLPKLLTDLIQKRHYILPLMRETKSFISLIGAMDDVARSNAWDWDNTFKYLKLSAEESFGLLVETDARYQAYTSYIQIQIAARDTRISQMLAADSAKIAVAAKRDSTSMKIIAVLGTLFLPSTFVASILSTPEYSYWPPGVTWRFWSISMPLTVVVMAGLLTWFWYDTRHTHTPPSKDKPDVISLETI